MIIFSPEIQKKGTINSPYISIFLILITISWSSNELEDYLKYMDSEKELLVMMNTSEPLSIITSCSNYLSLITKFKPSQKFW